MGRRESGARLLVGIVLGENSGIDPELRDAFQASGLTHLLAVSGQNIAIVAFGVVLAARILGFGRLVGEALAILVVLAVRAGGRLAAVGRAGRRRGRRSPRSPGSSRVPATAGTPSRVGALILLAWMPRSALEPGFQLSFAAVAAIFVVVPRLSGVPDAYPVRRASLGRSSSSPVACGLVTAPIVWLHFGRVALWTVPANVAAEPAMPPLVSLSLAAAAVEPVLPGVATALAWLAGWCAWWLALVARDRRRLAVGAGLVADGHRRRCSRGRRGRRRSSPAALPAAGGGRRARVAGADRDDGCVRPLRPSPSWTPPRGLRVTFLDVGQGDSALVEAPGGAVLVDEGPPEADVAGQLRRLGVRSLTAIVLTHPQRDHIGGAAAVLDRLSVGAVADPGSRRRRATTTRRSPRRAETASRSSSSTQARYSRSGG